MQLHAALRDDTSFLGVLKRQLSHRGSVKRHQRDRSTSTASKRSLVALDMSTRIDWNSRTESCLDEPATRPSQTMLLIEIPELQAVCVNHGERQFRIERPQAITVRDVLIELDKFLHRPAPKVYGNFKTMTVKNEGQDELEQPRSPKLVTLDMTPDSSESSLSSEADKKPVESVLKRWLSEKTVFAGLRRAENHDYKLFVKMVQLSKDSSLAA